MTSLHQGDDDGDVHFDDDDDDDDVCDYHNDSRPWGFPGLRPGDRWCLCSRRWR